MTAQGWIEKSKKPIWADTPFDGEEIAVHKQAFVEEGAQHLAAALEEIARLQAQLSQAERVVVPELTEDAIRREWCNLHVGIDGDPDENVYGAFEEGVKQGYDLANSRAHSVPASRVLKDGEVAIQESERNVLLVLERYARKHGPESIQYAIDTLDALRAQGKEKP